MSAPVIKTEGIAKVVPTAEEQLTILEAIDLEIKVIRGRGSRHNPIGVAGIQAVAVSCSEQGVIKVLGPHEADFFADRYHHVQRAVGKPVFLEYPNGFNDDGQGRFIISPENRCTIACKYPVFKLGFNIIPRTDCIHMT